MKTLYRAVINVDGEIFGMQTRATCPGDARAQLRRSLKQDYGEDAVIRIYKLTPLYGSW